MADYANQLSQYFGPTQLGANTNQLYQLLARSPQFQQALTQNYQAAGNFQNNLAAGLGQRGLSTSGIGTVANAMGSSAGTAGEASLRGGLFGQAGNMALENLLARLQAYSSYRNVRANQPTFLGQVAGGLFGAAGSVLGGPFGASLFGPKQQQTAPVGSYMSGPLMQGEQRPQYGMG